ncbi:MAG: hypothetical protein AABZ74_00550 [Cyanobacteriota bacterium]
MKKVLLALLGSLFLSNTAFALPNNIQLDYISKGVESSSETYIYYTSNKIKIEESKNQIIKGKPLEKPGFLTNFFDAKKNEIYVSFDGGKNLNLFKKASPKKVRVFGIIPYQMKFDEINDMKKIETNLAKKGFIKKSDEKIKLSNKNFDCNVFELTLKDQYKTKEGVSNSATTKVWIDKKLMFPVKESHVMENGTVLFTYELKSIKENVKFGKDFFIPSKSAKIEVSKESYDSIIKD